MKSPARPDRAGTHGVHWETSVARVERLVLDDPTDDTDLPKPPNAARNRRERRAARKGQRR